MQCNVSKSQGVEAILNATLLNTWSFTCQKEHFIIDDSCVSLFDLNPTGLSRTEIRST